MQKLCWHFELWGIDSYEKWKIGFVESEVQLGCMYVLSTCKCFHSKMYNSFKKILFQSEKKIISYFYSCWHSIHFIFGQWNFFLSSWKYYYHLNQAGYKIYFPVEISVLHKGKSSFSCGFLKIIGIIVVFQWKSFFFLRLYHKL